MDEETRAAFGRMDRYFELGHVQHQELRTEMHAGFAELHQELRTEMHAGFAEVRAEFKSEIGGLRTEFSGLRDEFDALRAEFRSFRDWATGKFAARR